MNNLVLKEKQEFMGIQIPVIEGGFGEGQKVMLVKTIAEIHEVELKFVNLLINNNLEEFEEGIDILDLKNSVVTNNPLLELGFTKQAIANSKNIYLLSEQGYMALVGLMRTDKAKEIRRKLRREYFSMRAERKQEPKSDLDLLELQVKALRAVESKVEKVDQKVDKKFDELPLFPADVKNLKKIVNKIVVPLLGGKKSNAYKPLSKKVFSDLYGQVFREFGVDASSEIKRKDFEFAKEVVRNYILPTALKNEIDMLNNQSQLNI